MLTPRIYFILHLLLFSPSIFAQVPDPAAVKQDPLKDSVDRYTKMGQFQKAVSFAEQWAEGAKKKQGEESLEYALAMNALGDGLRRAGKPKEAEPILLKTLDIRKKQLSPDNLDLAWTLNSLGMIYDNLGNYKKAEPLFMQALEIRTKVQGPAHPDLANVLINLGILFSNSGTYSKSEPYFLTALNIRKKALGPEHPGVTALQNNLGNMYLLMGEYKKAEPLYLQALALRKKKLGPDHPDVAASLNNLGTFYFRIGDFNKSEIYAVQSLEIKKKALGMQHPEVAFSMAHLGLIYKNLGDYTKAEQYFLEALEISKKALGLDNPEVANLLDNLGSLYVNLGDYAKSMIYFQQAFESRKKNLDPNHPNMAESLNRFGNIHVLLGEFSKAEPLYLQALETKKKLMGPDHPELVTSLNGLGTYYAATGEFTKSEQYYQQAIDILKKAFGPEHPLIQKLYLDMAKLYDQQGKKDQAKAIFENLSYLEVKFINRYFSNLSDQGKEALVNAGDESRQYQQAFYVQHYPMEKSISAKAFNAQLFFKGLLLNSSTKWKHRIRTSQDTTLTKKFAEWEAASNRISKLISTTDSAQQQQLKNLQSVAENLEKELVKRSEGFASLADKTIYTWKDVQAKLKPGEVAIEIVRVRKPGISRVVTDTTNPMKPVYQIKGLTDTIHYAAYIVNQKSLYPEMVLLTNGNDLEGRWLAAYKNSMKRRLEDESSYQQFWKKIGNKLEPGVKRVYLAPDGIYNTINLNTLKNPKTGKFLVDELDIHQLTNTKELITASAHKSMSNYACLVGFPEYNADKNNRIELTTREQAIANNSYYLNLTRSDAFAPLPGTKAEVESISALLQPKGWKVEKLTGEQALEENIKRLQMPKLLHIATHGFFEPEEKKGNPLLKSGLLLTGANKTLQGEKNPDVEDGVLTSLEAMNLNLDNTDLVVLSACETGLGEIKNGEGVYGLQRAFKVAGAKTLIMSLWKVSDEATQELMVSFYKHWLSAKSGNKRTAFLKAQKDLKIKYPNPYYWGAFVMVGE